jgi:hypothetical protein
MLARLLALYDRFLANDLSNRKHFLVIIKRMQHRNNRRTMCHQFSVVATLQALMHALKQPEVAATLDVCICSMLNLANTYASGEKLTGGCARLARARPIFAPDWSAGRKHFP